MASERIGIWFIGAQGGVATTSVVGLACLKQGLTGETGLVSGAPRFARLQLANWDRFVVGGHEIRQTSYADAARTLHEKSRVFRPSQLEQIAPQLVEWDKNIRPGTLVNVGPTIESISDNPAKDVAGESPQAAIQRVSADLKEFRAAHELDRVIVVNTASTEPPVEQATQHENWDELAEVLETATDPALPASSLYAVAAMQSGCAFVNFTPSIGSDLPALEELALKTGTLHMGRDGKTGETLLKSVLAPMFARRNLEVMSWVGHNIFGNLDGLVLDDPINKENKVRSKDHLLTEILGYSPQTLVSIEYIESMADWKTAWDHIHFNGFLDTPMTMQFTWQGCDSLLAAPLVLDLVRFTEREMRRGTSGVMSHLASFFKSPQSCHVPEFDRQYQQLLDWADEIADET